jgi:hypothetical protein
MGDVWRNNAGFEPVQNRLVGKAFERSVDGFITGEVIFVDA